MQILAQPLPGCFLVQPKKIADARGYFVKTYHEELYASLGLQLNIREEFYSSSHQNVLRGMHFQSPPHAHEKLVYCVRGEVRDVLLDLRSGAGYGRVCAVPLSGANGHILFIPKGIAHGFVALCDDSLMVYKTSTVHAPASDCGIRWDSFGYDWGVTEPIVSLRDSQHMALADFRTPF
jgi:dTDP-4-dehydrorhamnose 3,5-epimerase/CDP-3, 6-dideoxy-D-glycero-D-glycero-4-hexulose-5-epimerase